VDLPIPDKRRGLRRDDRRDGRCADRTIFSFRAQCQDYSELGALEGAQSFLLADRPGVERVFALEGREANLRKARFVREKLQMQKVEFAQANLEETDLSTYGEFDAVFCCGLLYHLPRPWDLIRQFPLIAPILFLWTHYAGENEAGDLLYGLRGKIHIEGGPDEPLSGLSPTATWLTLDSLLSLLTSAGYQHVEVIHDDPNHVNGRTVAIGARRESA
jgi:SAM-dependent methyltransferase